ncbi:hypothetical protein DY000_02006761 [Brassica cretica]|uniref:Uncharacterized protein n=1 Tax=Brassica cretica TaxID=69181 RepID=A0ABQ7C2Z6_BRACR|nr:hypothetical protein DY000_02006761 [Brassica cretica]
MSDTHYHGEEISADTYATLRRHQFNLESHEDRLQGMENTTTTMKEKWLRGDEAMRDFTGPDTCLKILASCDRYPQGKAYTFILLRNEHLLDRPLSQRRIYARNICKRKQGSSVSYDNHYPRDSYHTPAVHQVVEKPGRYIKRKLLGPATIENRETPSLLLRDLLNWELSAERVQMACFYASTHKLLLRKHQSSRLHRLAPPSPRRHQKPRASPSLARSQRFNSARPRSGIGELVLPRVQSVAPA